MSSAITPSGIIKVWRMLASLPDWKWGSCPDRYFGASDSADFCVHITVGQRSPFLRLNK